MEHFHNSLFIKKGFVLSVEENRMALYGLESVAKLEGGGTTFFLFVFQYENPIIEIMDPPLSIGYFG